MKEIISKKQREFDTKFSDQITKVAFAVKGLDYATAFAVLESATRKLSNAMNSATVSGL